MRELREHNEESTAAAQNSKARIAIVGMSCLFPGAPDISSFWTNIVNGVDSIRETTSAEWEPAKFYKQNSLSLEDIYCKRGGFVTEYADFDPLQHGVMPNSIWATDPDQLLALRVASEALADAGYDRKKHAANQHEVVLGRTSISSTGSMNITQRVHTMRQMMDVIRTINPEFSAEQLQLIEQGLKSSLHEAIPESLPGVMPNVMAGRIAGRLGFKGRSLILDSACASSLIAVEIAVRDLQSHQCDMALAGGVHVNNFAVFYQLFCSLGALSRTEQIRPFDENADGTILGEGIGMVVLKRLDDAVKDGDRIYAIISGIGSSSDGQGTSMLAPSHEGESLALSRAYTMAGISPRTVGLLEAHGTGTPTGDVAELQAVQKVFGTAELGEPWCAIGSVKSMIGHCQAASGIAGLIKTALALYHRVLPPTLNVRTPNPQFNWQTSPVYINTEARPWIHPKIHPLVPDDVRMLLEAETGTAVRRAAVSAFGFGGVNAHAVLEEIDDKLEAERTSFLQNWGTELCVMAAASRSELVAQIDQLSAFLEVNATIELRHVAYSLAQRAHGPACTERLALVAHSVPDLQEKLSRMRDSLSAGEAELSFPDTYFASQKAGCAPPKMAFVLPGLGAAYPNMLSQLCVNFPEVRAVFDFVDQLATGVGTELLPSRKIYPRPFTKTSENSATLASMDSAVVTVLMAEWALNTVLQRLELQPDTLLGCSTGEFAALTISGAADILTASPLFFRLSTAVSQSVPKEKLADLRSIMVRADYEQFAKALEGIEGLYVSSAMSPQQTILSGAQDSINEAIKTLSRLGHEAHILPMAIPYHTPLVAGLVDDEHDEFIDLPIAATPFPVWSCSQVGTYPDDAEKIRKITTELFTQPIMLKKTIEKMYEAGIRVFVEVGPKGVLTPLIHDTLAGKPHTAVSCDSAHTPSLMQLQRCLGELFANGVAMRLDYLFARRSPRLLDFTQADSAKTKSHSVKLPLAYPDIKMPVDVAQQVRALSPIPPERDSAMRVNDEPSRGGPHQGDPVLESYLTQMASFHQNLMSMQEQVMVAYMDQEESEEPWTEEAQTEYPALRCGLIDSQQTEISVVIDVNLTLDTHQYLLDHAIGGVVNGRNERVFLLPLTVALEMMCEAGALITPGAVVTKLSDIRAARRIRVSVDGCMLRVSAQREADGSITSAIKAQAQDDPHTGSDMQCKIHFAHEYPQAIPLHLPECDGGSPRLSPQELYSSETMFHGPRMQSVAELLSTGKKVTTARVRSRAASDWFAGIAYPQFIIDPLLLDNTTQPVLFHLFERNDDVTGLLPFLSSSLEFFGNLSALRGDAIVHAVLNSVTSRGTEADVFITDELGNVVAKFTGLTSRRITLAPLWKAYVANPANTYISRELALPAELPATAPYLGRTVTTDLLPDDDVTLAWCLDYVIGQSELQQYQTLSNLQRKREWVAGRIAAKDAVRQLAAQAGLRLCPADVIIDTLPDGRPIVRTIATSETTFSAVVSISHKDGIAVAIAAPSNNVAGLGIDIEKITARDEGFEQLACTAKERERIQSYPVTERSLQLTRMWCAKEAAGKALGQGLSSNPASIHTEVVAQSETMATFTARTATGNEVAVHCLNDTDTVIATALSSAANLAYK